MKTIVLFAIFGILIASVAAQAFQDVSEMELEELKVSNRTKPSFTLPKILRRNHTKNYTRNHSRKNITSEIEDLTIKIEPHIHIGGKYEVEDWIHPRRPSPPYFPPPFFSPSTEETEDLRIPYKSNPIVIPHDVANEVEHMGKKDISKIADAVAKIAPVIGGSVSTIASAVGSTVGSVAQIIADVTRALGGGKKKHN